MSAVIHDVATLQLIIRNSKEAVEKELGPIISKTETGQTLNNFQYNTYLELIRGIMYNVPKNITMKDGDRWQDGPCQEEDMKCQFCRAVTLVSKSTYTPFSVHDIIGAPKVPVDEYLYCPKCRLMYKPKEEDE